MRNEPLTAPTSLGIDVQLECLRAMYEIRFFEEECQRLFAERAGVGGSTHLVRAREPVVVGASRALRPTDTMLCTYRGHGAVLAKGAPLDRCFAEIIGRANGLCGGKGGSMHLTDVSVGALGSFAIVGAHLPIAAGVAFAARYRGSDDVTICYFGDGATNIGAFHEALNLAQLWKLPVIYVCENNLYGEYSPIASTTAIVRLADRGSAYGIEAEAIDGNDLFIVHDAISKAASRARAGDGPTFIEALTYRHKGHSRTDPAKYRPAGELERWLERDPVVRLSSALQEQGVGQGVIDALRNDAETTVTEALERARGWPDPDPQARLEHVYA